MKVNSFFRCTEAQRIHPQPGLTLPCRVSVQPENDTRRMSVSTQRKSVGIQTNF